MNNKSRVTAAILAFFLGGFGIHRFYTGETMKGILYLIFCWTLIPGMIAFIDFIVWIIQSDQEFDAKYNNLNFNNKAAY